MMGDAAGESEAWASAGLCVGEGGGGGDAKGGWGRARYGEVDQEEEKGRKTKSGH